MSTILVQNANVFAPQALGKKDLLLGGGKILAIEDSIAPNNSFTTIWDAKGRTMTPGIIDQHIHVIGAGGKRGFASMTPEVKVTDLIACGTTTVVGLLGTDGSTRSIKSLYAKVMGLEAEGISAYMYTGFYGLEPAYITDSVQNDMIFIEKILGCKVAITDIRSSYPTDLELLRLLRQVRVGGMIANKKGILHIHLGNLKTKMDILFRLVQEHEFPIANISPTHVGRTLELFEQAIEFAKLGGIIDITTGASKYTDPYKSVLLALDRGVPINKMTFSSDGNAGLDRLDSQGNFVGFRSAPFDQNLAQIIALIVEGGLPIGDAFMLGTLNPATNLGLQNKGRITVGSDADLLVFDEQWKITEVFAKGNMAMAEGKVLFKNSFEA